MASMTQSDFVFIAKSLNNTLTNARKLDQNVDTDATHGVVAGVRLAIANMTDALESANPRFKRDLFHAACTK